MTAVGTRARLYRDEDVLAPHQDAVLVRDGDRHDRQALGSI